MTSYHIQMPNTTLSPGTRLRQERLLMHSGKCQQHTHLETSATSLCDFFLFSVVHACYRCILRNTTNGSRRGSTHNHRLTRRPSQPRNAANLGGLWDAGPKTKTAVASPEATGGGWEIRRALKSGQNHRFGAKTFVRMSLKDQA